MTEAEKISAIETYKKDLNRLEQMERIYHTIESELLVSCSGLTAELSSRIDNCKYNIDLLKEKDTL